MPVIDCDNHLFESRTLWADHADPGTRTFRIEVELPNPEAKLRDGVSADGWGIGADGKPSSLLPQGKPIFRRGGEFGILCRPVFDIR